MYEDVVRERISLCKINIPFIITMSGNRVLCMVKEADVCGIVNVQEIDEGRTLNSVRRECQIVCGTVFRELFLLHTAPTHPHHEEGPLNNNVYLWCTTFRPIAYRKQDNEWLRLGDGVR